MLNEKYNEKSINDDIKKEDATETLEFVPLGEENFEESDFEPGDSILLTRKQKKLKISTGNSGKNTINVDANGSLKLASCKVLPSDNEVGTCEDDDTKAFSDLDSEEEDDHQIDTLGTAFSPVRVIPLYSRLSVQKQKLIFQPSPDPNARLIVVATNIAETSLTIPGIRYVVDSGREKKRVYNQLTGTSTFKVDWISQSSAKQRMGRAGRTGPGHCYRLYSSAVYLDVFSPKTQPEILTVPIDDLVLYMKTLGIDHVQNFPFPTRLNLSSVKVSMDRLRQLGVLDENFRVTALGKQVAELPTNVRLAKMIVVAKQDPRFVLILPHVLAIASLMSLPSPFDTQKIPHLYRGDRSSDSLALLRAAGAYLFSPSEIFCATHQLNFKIMKEFENLFSQLQRLLNVGLTAKGKLKCLSGVEEESLLKQSVCVGLIDRIAKKMEPSKARSFSKIMNFPFPPRKLREWPYEHSQTDDVLFIHANSCLFTDGENEGDFNRVPEFIAYSSVNEFGKMEGCTVVDSKWLRSLSLGTPMFQDSICETPEPYYDVETDKVFCFVKPKFGAKGWNLPLEKIICTDAKLTASTFARSLLEGKVIGKLIDEKHATAPFAHCTRAPLQPRVVALVGKLMKSNILRKVDLQEKWKIDSFFLQRELLDWIKFDQRKEFESTWNSIITRK